MKILGDSVDLLLGLCWKRGRRRSLIDSNRV